MRMLASAAARHAASNRYRAAQAAWSDGRRAAWRIGSCSEGFWVPKFGVRRARPARRQRCRQRWRLLTMPIRCATASAGHCGADCCAAPPPPARHVLGHSARFSSAAVPRRGGASSRLHATLVAVRRRPPTEARAAAAAKTKRDTKRIAAPPASSTLARWRQPACRQDDVAHEGPPAARPSCPSRPGRGRPSGSARVPASRSPLPPRRAASALKKAYQGRARAPVPCCTSRATAGCCCCGS